MQINSKEIGGYFEFGLSNLGQFPYPNAVKYYSARSAFFDLLQQKQIKKIWMPKFICDSMIEPLNILHIKILYYNLSDTFAPILPALLNKDEYLLYVNYFGICSLIQNDILDLYPNDQIIFDHSQAFFLAPLDCFATIYSPRKFLPVAEGGLLLTNQDIIPDYHSREVSEMIEQYQYGLIRCLTQASNAYQQFKNSEIKFNDCIPKKISAITEEILQSLDYAQLKEKRLNNFKFLHDQLGGYNQLKIDLDEIESPLTYPLMMDKVVIDFLINKKIYTPTYWLDSLVRVELDSFEHKLIAMTTHLICDHRYSLEDMQYQVDILKDFLNEY